MRLQRGLVVALGWGLVTAVHGLVAQGTHGLHVLHIVFGALYLVPTVAAALWLGTGTALALSLASALAYVLHARAGGGEEVGEGANHLVLAAVFLFVGGVVAGLVRAAQRERARHAQVEQAAEREAVIQAITSLSAALRSRDDGTATHCQEVARVAVAIARQLGLEEACIETLRLAALVHDVGKIGVRDDVLLKPGALSPEERARMEQHPRLAAQMLAPVRGGQALAAIVVAHHEAPDGSGYPARLTADRIPREAAILRVADVFAALTERRPYKPPMAAEAALQQMRSWTGKLDVEALGALEAWVCRGQRPALHA